jgi:hypothetical protein
LVVFHTPPPAVATYQVFGSLGCVAISSMRPETFPYGPATAQSSGAGPMKVQLEVLSGIEVDKNTRRSRGSRLNVAT